MLETQNSLHFCPGELVLCHITLTKMAAPVKMHPTTVYFEKMTSLPDSKRSRIILLMSEIHVTLKTISAIGFDKQK